MSDLRRFFVSEVTDGLIIDGEEFRHAVNVRDGILDETGKICMEKGISYRVCARGIFCARTLSR